MTPQQIVALGIRLVSIFLAFFSLKFLVALPLSMASANMAEQVPISYTTGGLALFLAVVLWFFPMAVAHRILPRTRSENALHLQAFEAARVGCTLIGLWFLVSVLPAFVWFIFSNLANSGHQSLYRHLNSSDRLQACFYLVELAFALGLIFRSHIFARLVFGDKTRDGGNDSGL